MAELDYELPSELIAQQPIEPRDASRLLVYRRDSATIEHATFSDLPGLLGDELVVVNDSRVVPARLRLRRASGGAVELLLLEAVAGEGMWEALARPTRRLRAGERVGPVELLEPLGDGRWLIHLDGEPNGDAPLPPYIQEPLRDPERYQTVYARESGSAAAPTAGLHFTADTLAGLEFARVTRDRAQLRDLYLPELPRQWEREHANFRFIPVLSEAAPEDQWTGRIGLVHEAILADFPDLSSHQVYACGSAGMVEAAYPAFQAHGLRQDDCFSDAFRLAPKIRTDAVELAKLGGSA